MSDQNVPPSVATTTALSKRFKLVAGIAAVMVALALLGIGLTTTQRDIAPKYWISLVPIYGLLCIGTAAYRSRHHEGTRVQVVRQVFHWIGIAAALALDFFIRGTGEETGVAAGYNALLLLALGCFLAGVHLEWLFSLVGVLLILTLLVVVKAEQYLWLIALLCVLALAALLGWKRLAAKFSRNWAANNQKHHSVGPR